MKIRLALFIVALLPLLAWGADGDVFTANVPLNGTSTVSMTFKVISEYKKTCQVGVEDIYYTSCIEENVSGSVAIPSKVNGYSVTSIGSSAFIHCSSLTSVTIPNSVISIGYGAFSDCKALTSVTIPNSVTSIERSVFSNCSGLTTVEIHNSVTEIGESAFYGCSGLNSVTIPNSVTSIGDGAFAGCSGLTSINVEKGNTKYDSRNGCNAIIETDNNTLVAGCVNTVIPNSVTSIGSYAFSGCSGLVSVTIPNSVTCIGDNAFYNCSGLTSVTIPNSVTNIGSSAFERCSGLTSVSIPNSVTSIGSSAFSYCSRLTSVNIPKSVINVGDRTFSDCVSLTTVTIPISVISIEYGAFSGCSGLTTVEIPNSVTTIRDEAFYHCSSLTSVTIPNSVITIENGAFKGCSSLGSIKVEKGNMKYDSRNGCNAIIETDNNTLIAGCVNTVIPNSVTSIGDYAFSGCSSLTFVAIPNSATSIGRYAFSGCTGLTSVTIPNSVTSIGNYAFASCSDLTEVISLIEEPFKIDRSVFGVKTNSVFIIDFTSATLYVPAGCKEKYEATPAWNKFTKIVEENVEPVTDSDDLQAFIDDLVNNGDKGTADNPKKIPVAEDGLTIDKDVNVDDDLQLYIDGLANGGTHIAFIDDSNINIRHGGCVLRVWNSIFSSSATKSNAKGVSSSISQGGILNEGTLTLAACTLDEGQYTVNNLSSGCLMLKEGTTVNGMQNIENSGTLYIDGTCPVNGLTNRHGGRILLTSQPTQPINVTIADASDVEDGQPIVSGTDGYRLTEVDADKLVINVPDGYEYKFDELLNALVVTSTNGITNLTATTKEVKDTYDLTGRRTESPKNGLRIQRMRNGVVKKIIIK